MTTYTVQGPSGKSYTIDGPEGATADQLGQVILSQSHDERVAHDTANMRAEYNPTNDMGTGERVLAGIGRGMASVGRGIGQAVNSVLPAQETTAGNAVRTGISMLPGGDGLLNLETDQAHVDDAKATDAPLMATRSGKVGSAIGTAAALAPVAMIPGANTYAGAAAIGGATGALTTEGDLAERAKGAAGGAIGGAAGVGIGRALGGAASYVKSRIASNALAAAPKQAAVQAAQDAGYVLPPNEIQPDLKNALLQAWSGPIKTTQAAAAANQGVTNSLAAKAVGLPADQPITVDALNSIRNTAGQAYQAVADSGVIKPTPAYEAALDKLAKPFRTAAAGFPNAKPNPIIDTIESLKSPEFDAAAAVSKISELRDAADVAYRAGDKAAGKALKGGASAIEDAIDQHLQATGAPADVLQGFRDARTTIAKTYDVQKALKGENVNALTLANLQQKYPGRLTNELADIASTAQNFPKATALLKESPSPYSAVDGFGSLTSFGTAAALHNPLTALPAAGIAARPLVRSAILSDAGQRFAAMQPGPTLQNALANAAQSRITQGATLVGGITARNLLAR
jgi:hypothetical protein